MASKLKALKMDIKQWNNNEFDNINFKQQKLSNSLHVLETTGDSGDLSVKEKVKRAQMISDLEKNIYLEEIC